MITEDYVTYGVAKLLKKKGFDVPCLASYHIEYPENKPVWSPNPVNDEGWPFMNAPTHQMARKWLRDEKRVYIDILLVPHNDGGISWMFSWYQPDVDDVIHSDFSEYSNYEECSEAAIKYALENLI